MILGLKLYFKFVYLEEISNLNANFLNKGYYIQKNEIFIKNKEIQQKFKRSKDKLKKCREKISKLSNISEVSNFQIKYSQVHLTKNLGF